MIAWTSRCWPSRSLASSRVSSCGWSGQPDLAVVAWSAGVIPVLAALFVEIVRSLWKGEVGLDIVAALSMSAALLFGETLAAAVVALMYSGGTFLESFAEGRARREMSDLLVPRAADGDTAPQRRARRGAPGRHRAGRPAADPAGRRGAGGRHRGERPRDAGPVGADRRVDARAAGARTGGDERLDERRRRLRSAGHPPRGGQHLCRDRPAGRGGAEIEGADGPAGRPLLASLPRRHGRPGHGGLVVHRRSDPRGGGSGGGHAMPADPCRPGGARGRDCRGRRISGC